MTDKEFLSFDEIVQFIKKRWVFITISFFGFIIAAFVLIPIAEERNRPEILVTAIIQPSDNLDAAIRTTFGRTLSEYIPISDGGFWQEAVSDFNSRNPGSDELSAAGVSRSYSVQRDTSIQLRYSSRNFSAAQLRRIVDIHQGILRQRVGNELRSAFEVKQANLENAILQASELLTRALNSDDIDSREEVIQIISEQIREFIDVEMVIAEPDYPWVLGRINDREQNDYFSYVNVVNVAIGSALLSLLIAVLLEIVGIHPGLLKKKTEARTTEEDKD